MVTLRVTRNWKKDSYTIGRLYVNEAYWCNTLEDADRGLDSSMSLATIKLRKVYGETAIPTGLYEVKLTYSPKFATRTWGKKYSGLVPEICNVKGYSGVRIHPFNTAEESLGCIGPGENKMKGKIVNSTKWYYRLMDDILVPAHRKGEQIFIDIV